MSDGPVWVTLALSSIAGGAFLVAAKRAGMDRRLMWRIIFAIIAVLGLIAVAMNFVGHRLMDGAQARLDAFARTAEGRAIAASKEPSARVLSIRVDGVVPLACGWIDLGAKRGTTAFEVSGYPAEKFADVSFGEIGGATRADRAVGLFYRTLMFIDCKRDLPPPPAGVTEDSSDSRELAALWAGPAGKKDWAIIEPNADGVFLGVGRRKGGGLIITPGFSSRSQVEAWLQAEGNALAAESNALGADAIKRFRACLHSAKSGTDKDNCPIDGMDEVVKLAPSGAWRQSAVADKLAP